MKVRERIVLDPGYRRALGAEEGEEEHPRLTQRKVGERVWARAQAHPRAGLSEAEWIAMMQSRGVGRPSTYAETLAKVRQHRYVEEAEGRLRLSERGRRALEWLERQYPEVFAVDFSVRLEEMLDELAAGRRRYREVIEAVWRLLE